MGQSWNTMRACHPRLFSSFANLSSSSRVVLASPELGSSILRNLDDPYYATLTAKEIHARVRQRLSVPEFAEFQAQQTLSWTAADEAEILERFMPKMRRTLEERFPRLVPLLPPVTNFFLTNGSEETSFASGPKSFIAFCRGSDSVFMSRQTLNFSTKGLLERAHHLLWHEMWHIVSRNMSAAQRDAVYRPFGFEPLQHRVQNEHPERLSNPDALYLEHYMEVAGERMVPLLLIDKSFDASDRDASVFQFMQLCFTCLDEAGQIDLHRTYDLNRNEGLLHKIIERMGRNTSYLLHVEEVVAENFAMLANEETVADPEKLKQLE